MQMRAFDIERKAKLMQAELMAHMLIGFDHGELVDRATWVFGKIYIDIVGKGNGVERLVEGLRRDLLHVYARPALARNEAALLELIHNLLDCCAAHVIRLGHLHNRRQLIVRLQIASSNTALDIFNDVLVFCH